jgi:hypothetical protein
VEWMKCAKISAIAASTETWINEVADTAWQILAYRLHLMELTQMHKGI